MTTNEEHSKKDIQKSKKLRDERLKIYEKQNYPKQSYAFFNKRKVKVFLTNGESLTGYIVKEWTYEILLVKSDNIKDNSGRSLEKRSIIPKHAIIYTSNLIHLSVE